MFHAKFSAFIRVAKHLITHPFRTLPFIYFHKCTLGASGGLLAAETCRAGGLGFIAAGHLNTKDSMTELEEQINIFRQKSEELSSTSNTTTKLPLAIGFIGHSTFGCDLGWELFESVLQKHKPDVVQFFAPAIHHKSNNAGKTTNVQMAQTYGSLVMAQVGTFKDAMEAIDAGVDCIIAQGSEAGGHGVQRGLGNGTLSLTSRLVKICQELSDGDLTQAKKQKANHGDPTTSTNEAPVVLAAGGISDGRAVAAALSLGADGVVIGTRLWATNESLGPLKYKQALVDAKSCDDAVRTRVFDSIYNSYRKLQWPEPYDSSGVLRNKVTERWENNVTELIEVLVRDEMTDIPNAVEIISQHRQAIEDDDVTVAPVYSGQGVGEILSIEPAYTVVDRIGLDAMTTLQELHKNVLVSD